MRLMRWANLCAAPEDNRPQLSTARFDFCTFCLGTSLALRCQMRFLVLTLSVLLFSGCVLEDELGGGGGGPADRFGLVLEDEVDCADGDPRTLSIPQQQQQAQHCYEQALLAASEMSDNLATELGTNGLRLDAEDFADEDLAEVESASAIAARLESASQDFALEASLSSETFRTTGVPGFCETLLSLVGDNDPLGLALIFGEGVAVSVVVGGAGIGREEVWDLNHSQYLANGVAGVGFGSVSFGPSAQVFGGVGFNFFDDAGDALGWSGGAGVAFPIPQVPFLQVGAGGFVSLVDVNGFPGGIDTNGDFGVVGFLQASIPFSAWRMPGWLNRFADRISRNGELGLGVNYAGPAMQRTANSYNTLRPYISVSRVPIGQVRARPSDGNQYEYLANAENFSVSNCFREPSAESNGYACAVQMAGSYHWSRAARMSAAMALLNSGPPVAWLIPTAYGAFRSLGGVARDQLEELCTPQSSS